MKERLDELLDQYQSELLIVVGESGLMSNSRVYELQKRTHEGVLALREAQKVLFEVMASETGTPRLEIQVGTLEIFQGSNVYIVSAHGEVRYVTPFKLWRELEPIQSHMSSQLEYWMRPMVCDREGYHRPSSDQEADFCDLFERQGRPMIVVRKGWGSYLLPTQEAVDLVGRLTDNVEWQEYSAPRMTDRSMSPIFDGRVKIEFGQYFWMVNADVDGVTGLIQSLEALAIHQRERLIQLVS